MLDDAAVKIISALRVNVTPAISAIDVLEKKFDSLNAKVAGTKLTLGGAGMQSASQVLGPITAQQTLITKATAEGEVKRASIVAKGEAQITAITAKEALLRQKAITEEARAGVLAVQRANELIKQSYML